MLHKAWLDEAIGVRIITRPLPVRPSTMLRLGGGALVLVVAALVTPPLLLPVVLDIRTSEPAPDPDPPADEPGPATSAPVTPTVTPSPPRRTSAPPTARSTMRPRRSPSPRSTRRAPSLRLDAERKRRAAQITSTFENSTTDIQYDYAENIGDGRGITAGRAGFTSGTSDLLLVVSRYTDRRPGNPLARYLPALRAVDGTSSVDGLDGFPDAWAEAAEDPLQRKVQDEVVDELYFDPAMSMAAGVGVDTPLGQAIIWDTMIQHGAGGDTGTEAIIAETRDVAGRADGGESRWLEAFLDVRLDHLHQMYDEAPDGYESSTSRIDALRSLVSAGKLTLDPPLTWEVYGTTFHLS
jgi:chitosanase